MDYQKAIETHINECKHRIDVIRKHVNTNGDADTDRCFENIKVLETAISAMKELQQYEKLGTLEEVREAVEKQKRKKPRATTNRCYVCPHCGLVTSIKIKHNYCDACGQHIDWSEENEIN